MTVPFIGDIIEQVGGLARELIPDADKKLELDFKLKELKVQAELRESELLQGQLEVNKVEAAHSNLFVAGWRPFIGWVSGYALAHTWIVAPMVKFGATLFGHDIDLPALPPDSIFPVVMAMLGIGGMRTVEKVQGVATSMGGKVLKTMNQVPVNEPAAERTADKPVAHKNKSRWFK